MNDTQKPTEELVVLVDESDTPIGTAPKATVHNTDTPLHRAFSLFIFNRKNELLLTKRASSKKTFPGVWTNTVCGHPAPGEDRVAAATRRLSEELGITGVAIREAAKYRYRFADASGIVENEICPIHVGFFDGEPNPNPEEVEDWKWMPWKDFLEVAKRDPNQFSPWSTEEALRLQQTNPELLSPHASAT